MKKLLSEYDFPKDLKNMSIEELGLLSYEIRAFLLDNISKTGGHLASNLGIVELTLALHKVFDSPKDKIIWDVGHQSYVHKILTGRASEFKNLRKFGFMSGFPKRKESPHDIYETGHASNSISVSLGIAAARDLRKEKFEVLSVIGDGSMSGGLSFEGLNNLGASKTKTITILNDNGMSIANNVGGLQKHLDKVRVSPSYKKTKGLINTTIKKIPYVGNTLKTGISEMKEAVKYTLITDGIFFEELGFTYLGPVDGHNIQDLIKFLSIAKKAERPVILHVITKKGKGYKEAEKNPDRFHGTPAFDLTTGLPLKKSNETYSNIFGRKLLSLANKHADVVGISAAMCDATGLGAFKNKYPQKFFDTGIAEAHSVAFAAGLAIQGMRPYVAIYSTFLQRAYDQIIEDVALHNLGVTFMIDRAGIVGADGETHHGVFDLSYLLPIPNMTVFAPYSKEDLEYFIEESYRLNRPCAIRYPRGEVLNLEKFEGLSKVRNIGQNQRLYEGKDLDIVAVGNMLDVAIETREILKKQNIDAGIIFVCRLKGKDDFVPLEPKKNLVILEDNISSNGYGAYLKSRCSNNMLIMGWPDKFIEHGKVEELRKKYKLDAQGVSERIVKEFERKA